MGTLLALTFHAAALSRYGVSVSFWPFLTIATGSNGSFSDGHDHEACRSNPMQMIGQVECKWVGKSMQLPVFRRERRDVL